MSSLGKVLRQVQNQATTGNYLVSQHCQQEMAEEDIDIVDVIDTLISGTIIENYPEHRRGGCCLVNGVAGNGRPLHVVCTTELPTLILITVYEPKSPKWLTSFQRRRL
ncbi:MAG: DUF4258 domain-containing protein [Peptococcaceae bacterium]|jgi:hypothetical protein|nr:DUF4258 domain-containing protein [Peptococcaceae bacterium]